ncbi:hypothetical protein [Granulicoccus sp. GXG6511]|uniref:hypothetical protein n=1 Tax=Granulicoccus sp. GXG6511 TaxID=3381351 RepID=UPI003D7CB5DF
MTAPQPAGMLQPQPDPPTGRAPTWWRTSLEIIRDTAAKVFWEPIVGGSPRWRAWPRGLRTIAVLAGLAYVVCAVLILASAQIRASDPLVHTNGDTYPAWATMVLLWSVVLVLALGLTAALHAHPVIRVVVLLYVSFTFVFPAVGANAAAVWAVLCVVGLIVFFIVRARRRFAWFEFPVVLSLVALGLYVPLATAPFGAGADLRPLYLALLMSVVSTLAAPVLVMAGYAPAEVAVTLGEWLVNRIGVETAGSRWRRRVVGGGVVVGLAVLVFDVGQGLRNQAWDFRADAWWASALVVAVSLGWCWLMLRRRPGEPPREPTAYAWEKYGWWIAVLWIAVIIPLAILIVGSAVLNLLGQPALFRVVQAAANSEQLFGVWRLMVCVVAVLWLVRARRLGERVAPVLLVSFVTMTALGAARPVSDGRLSVSWSLQPVVALAVGVSLVAVVVAVVRRRGVERQLWIALLALVLSALVGRRELLAEPGSLAAGVSGLAVLLIGLVWRVLTDAGFTRGDSRWFPLPSRVLFFAANALLGTLVLAHLALTRQEDPPVDVESMAMLGVNLIGAPLVLGAIVLGLVSTIGLEAPPRRVGRGTLRESPPDEKTVIRENPS